MLMLFRGLAMGVITILPSVSLLQRIARSDRLFHVLLIYDVCYPSFYAEHVRPPDGASCVCHQSSLGAIENDNLPVTIFGATSGANNSLRDGPQC